MKGILPAGNVSAVALSQKTRSFSLAYPVRYQSRSRVSPVAAVEFFIRGG